MEQRGRKRWQTFGSLAAPKRLDLGRNRCHRLPRVAVSSGPEPANRSRISRSSALSRFPTAREIPPKSRLTDAATQTDFFFFLSDTTGAEKLVSNPEQGGQLIPGSAALEVSKDLIEIFPIGADGHASPSTKQEEEQPPLTPNLDSAEDIVKDARSLEVRAELAYREKQGRKFAALITDSKKLVDKAEGLLTRAVRAGEVSQLEADIDDDMAIAGRLDAEALNPARADPGIWKKIRHDPARVRHYVIDRLQGALYIKNRTLKVIARERAARQVGK